MRNPCLPSTPRQNELQRREKQPLLYDPEKEISNTLRLAQEIAWLLTQPFISLSLSLAVYIQWGAGVQHQPHIFLLSLRNLHTNPTTLARPFNPLSSAHRFACVKPIQQGFCGAFKPHLIMTQFPIFHNLFLASSFPQYIPPSLPSSIPFNVSLPFSFSLQKLLNLLLPPDHLEDLLGLEFIVSICTSKSLHIYM